MQPLTEPHGALVFEMPPVAHHYLVSERHALQTVPSATVPVDEVLGDQGFLDRQVDVETDHAVVPFGLDHRDVVVRVYVCLLYTSPSPRDLSTSRMPSSA